MATATVKTYGKYWLAMANGQIDHSSDTFRIMAVDGTGYTPDFDADEFIDDGPRANEVTGTNWATDGPTVTITVSQDTASDQIRWAVGDLNIATVTVVDFDQFVIYQDTGTDSTSRLVAYGDWDTDMDATAGTLAIDFASPTWSIDYT